MKKVRFLSLLLALLITAACFAACGSETTDTTKAPVDNGPEYVDDGTVTNTQNRQSVKDSVPTDLNFSGK